MRRVLQSPISLSGIMIWGIAAVFFLYEFFLRTFLGSLAHQVLPDLRLNAETFALVGSVYYVAYALMQIPVGVLADKFGVKGIMLFAALVCVISTFWFAAASGFFSAFFSRLFMGFGSSFAFVCLLVVVVTWFPKKYFGFFAGISQFIGTLGPVLAAGPLVALVAQQASWRAALEEVGIAGTVLVVLILFFVKNKPRDHERTLIFLRKEEPLANLLLRLVRNRQVWCVAIYSATVYNAIALLGAIWGTEYLQARGLSQKIAADIISLAWLGYAFGCPIIGALSDIAKRRKPALLACSMIGLCASIGISYGALDSVHWAYGVLFFVLGFAASGQNIGFATIVEQVDFGMRATAIGLNNAAILLFGSVTPPLVSYFIYLSAGTHPTQLEPENFGVAFAVMPLFYLIATLIAGFLVKETYCKPQKEAIKLSP